MTALLTQQDCTVKEQDMALKSHACMPEIHPYGWWLVKHIYHDLLHLTWSYVTIYHTWHKATQVRNNTQTQSCCSTHTQIHKHTHTYTHTHTHTQTQTQKHIHTHIHTKLRLNTHKHTHTHIHTWRHLDTRAQENRQRQEQCWLISLSVETLRQYIISIHILFPIVSEGGSLVRHYCAIIFYYSNEVNSCTAKKLTRNISS